MCIKCPNCNSSLDIGKAGVYLCRSCGRKIEVIAEKVEVFPKSAPASGRYPLKTEQKPRIAPPPLKSVQADRDGKKCDKVIKFMINGVSAVIAVGILWMCLNWYIEVTSQSAGVPGAGVSTGNSAGVPEAGVSTGNSARVTNEEIDIAISRALETRNYNIAMRILEQLEAKYRSHTKYPEILQAKDTVKAKFSEIRVLNPKKYFAASCSLIPYTPETENLLRQVKDAYSEISTKEERIRCLKAKGNFMSADDHSEVLKLEWDLQFGPRTVAFMLMPTILQIEESEAVARIQTDKVWEEIVLKSVKPGKYCLIGRKNDGTLLFYQIVEKDDRSMLAVTIQ